MATIVLTESDRNHLKNIGASSLPDNPAQARYSPKEIKSAISRPNLLLFDWMASIGEFIRSTETLHVITDLEQAGSYPVGSGFLLNSDDDVRFFRKTNGGMLYAVGDSLKTTAEKFNQYYTKSERLVSEAIDALQGSLGLFEITAQQVRDLWGDPTGDLSNYDFDF